MTDARTTLADLFLDRQRQLTKAELQQLEQAGDTLAAQEQVSARDDVGGWPAAWSQLRDRLPELLDVPLLDILMAAWEKYGLLALYAEPGAQKPGERTTLDLDKRSLSSTHKPRVELRVNDQLIGTLPFTVKLQLQFKTLRLTVGDGRIWRIETGHCAGSGSVALSGQTLLERTFAKVALPGRVEFADGIPIPSLNRPYRWGDAFKALEATPP